MYYETKYPSPVGLLTLVSDGENLVGVWNEEQKYFSSTVSGSIRKLDHLPIFSTVKAWLNRYFAGLKPLISELPLRPAGNEFKKAVWNLLCEIPYGEITTYGAIAKEIAFQKGLPKMSAQAVGGAIAHNPISIIIPCHRVVGANGSLTGYAGGIQTKIKLLEHEGVDLSRLFVPSKGTAL